MKIETAKTASAFAPATVANVAVGFDLLGFPIQGVGDTVQVTQTQESGIRIRAIEGQEGLPMSPDRNTATVGLLAMIQALDLKYGFDVDIRKGIPIGSGMGGSAASAVAGLVAANALFEQPLPKERLLEWALLGERAASGASHPDNITPCLFGGMTLARLSDESDTAKIDVIEVPVPQEMVCVVVCPLLRVDTAHSRQVLKKEVSLKDHVQQSALFAGFLVGCFKSDIGLIGRSLKDILIEPQRAHLIPGFYEVQKAALLQGALGCSISGSGPAVFAWATTGTAAEKVQKAMVQAFQKKGVAEVKTYISPVCGPGARVLKPEVQE